MSRWSIQRIKAMLLYIAYGILFVDTVDTKIKAYNALNAMFVETVDILVFVALTQHLIQSTIRCENSTLLCIKWPLAPQYKTHPHISAHNFLNIQPIFNTQKSFGKLRIGAFQPYHQYYICWYCWYRTRISNAFNAIYVDTVDTKHIHTFLPITFLIFNQFLIRKMFWKAETKSFSTITPLLYMLILSILDITNSNTFNAIYVKASLYILYTIYLTCNGMHVNAVNTIKLQCRFLVQSLWITVKFDLKPWFTLNYNRVRIKTSN